jgi:hypothetical protein
MNRAERRAQQRLAQRAFVEQRNSSYAQNIIKRDEAKQKLIERLSQNGITPEDLKNEYEKGYSEGFLAAGEPVLRSCFAAVCLALNDLFKYEREECAEVLRLADQHMTQTLTSTEIIDEVYDRMKLRLDFKEPFDRIQEL